eukprot:SAG31_NODE_6463_length_2007_cov_1.937631_2_plen_338_part_00
MSHRSTKGYKYFCVFRCYNSGWYESLYLALKSEFVDKWIAKVDRIRADPRYQYATYKFMAVVRTDFDSVWDSRCKQAVREREKRGIIFEYGCPTDHRKKPRGEKSIRDFEMGTKALMVQYRLPIQMWVEAMESQKDAKNLWPMARSVVAIDGDAPVAWELATCNRVSHGMVLSTINKFVLEIWLCGRTCIRCLRCAQMISLLLTCRLVHLLSTISGYLLRHSRRQHCRFQRIMISRLRTLFRHAISLHGHPTRERVLNLVRRSKAVVLLNLVGVPGKSLRLSEGLNLVRQVIYLLACGCRVVELYSSKFKFTQIPKYPPARKIVYQFYGPEPTDEHG